MCGEVPDHPTAPRAVGEAVAVALEVEEPHDLAVPFGDQFDRRLLIAFLLSLDDVEKCGVEERQ